MFTKKQQKSKNAQISSSAGTTQQQHRNNTQLQEVTPSDILAVPLDSQVQKVQVPLGLKQGEIFIHTFSNDRVVTITVPIGVKGGQFIEVFLPDEAVVVDSNFPINSITHDLTDPASNSVRVPKAALGAAIVGGVVGAVLFGPISAVVLATGAAYLTTRTDNIGSVSSKVGKRAFTGCLKASQKGIEWARSAAAGDDGSDSPASPSTAHSTVRRPV